MLLHTLKAQLGKTHAFNAAHNPADYHPLSFELGDTTSRGIEVRATAWKKTKRAGKGYRIAGYFKQRHE